MLYEVLLRFFVAVIRKLSCQAQNQQAWHPSTIIKTENLNSHILHVWRSSVAHRLKITALNWVSSRLNEIHARSRESRNQSQRSVSARVLAFGDLTIDLYLRHGLDINADLVCSKKRLTLSQCIIPEGGDHFLLRRDILDADVEPFTDSPGSIWESSRTSKSSTVPRNCRRALPICPASGYVFPPFFLSSMGRLEEERVRGKRASYTRRNSKKEPPDLEAQFQ